MEEAQKEDGPLWVFAYGSLIWRPGFDFVGRRAAQVEGFRRSFSMRSVTYRGTYAAPGLVLALDRCDGAVCDGVVYEVAAGDRAKVLAYLRERELEYSGYEEVWVAAGGVMAVTYVIDPANEYYAGGLSLEAQAEIIARCEGKMGPNAEYLYATNAHLAEIGCADAELAALEAIVRELRR